MQPIATVHGVSVYSDKHGRISVVGSVVSFEDGSYVDVTTGEVVNKGLGSISIGGPPKGAGEKTRREEEFRVKPPAGLVIRNLMADVKIRTHPTNQILVALEGPRSGLDSISLRRDGNTVVIEGQDGGSRGAVVVRGDIVGGDVITVGRGTTITRGVVVVSGDAVAAGLDLSIEVTIPVQTNVEIDGVGGEVSLADIEGSLRAKVSGAGDIQGGKVQNTKLVVSGSGSVQLREVEGQYLDARIPGSGRVRVDAGRVDKIDCSVSGSGQINFGGVAGEGDLGVSGSGHIYVRQIVNRLSQSKSGSGSIRVGNRPQKTRRDWDW